MPDDIKPSGGDTDDLPEPVLRRRGFSALWIWLIPALAAIVGAGLVVRSSLEAGPTITISFQTGEPTSIEPRSWLYSSKLLPGAPSITDGGISSPKKS